MKHVSAIAWAGACLLVAGQAQAAITVNTINDADGNGLNGLIAVGDAISGLVATELPGDLGWHGATPGEPERLEAFTDDAGPITVLTGLLNDNPPVLGEPVKRLQYDLSTATDVRSIQILTGNFGADGRVFSSARILYSTDNGSSFDPLGGYVPTIGPNAEGYYQSHASGTINSGQWQSTMMQIHDDTGAAIALGVTNLIFDLYAVSNTQGQLHDPFNGVNPFTGVDDGLTAAFESPLVWEIDVIAVPEPASVVLLSLGLLGVLHRRRG